MNGIRTPSHRNVHTAIASLATFAHFKLNPSSIISSKYYENRAQFWQEMYSCLTKSCSIGRYARYTTGLRCGKHALSIALTDRTSFLH